MEWKAHPKIPTMILPKKESETLEQAVARYLQFLKSNPDMQKMRLLSLHGGTHRTQALSIGI
ncbi:MAG: hypothetical protein Fur0010_17830 [Bdellovibrio sp.]